MKVFISADIEGTAVTATREGCRPGEFEYERSRKEMTAEVVAAAEGARAAGAELVVVKDAHGPGLNILPEELPEYVQLIRSWSGSPEMMVEGLDSSFDAAFFVGYHNAAGEGGNALSHTINGGVVHRITVNGQPASEFLIYSWMAAWKQDLSAARITLPEHFRVELTYKSHRDAYTKGFYPGAERVDAMTLAYETGDWYEANRFLLFAI